MLWMILVSLFIFGAISGSFVVASVWRIRADQLVAEKQYKNADYSKLVKQNKLAGLHPSKDHSRCLSCGYKLRWFDLVPVFSWLLLRGRCRKCRQPIGLLELSTEIGLGLMFALSYLLWPLEVSGLGAVAFGLWATWLLAVTALFIYDLKWLELPVDVLYLSIVLAVLFASVSCLMSGFSVGKATEHLLAVIVLAGVYGILYIASKGRWVGSGDAFVGASVALILGDWRLAFLALFLANLIGSLVVTPSLISKKITFSSRIPMGPLLILAGVLVFWFGQDILSHFNFF